jgi:SSS family solute:Na+ symporter
MISILLLAVFLSGMVAIGFWGMKRTASLNDFFLGGRTIGPWMSAFAYGTTYFSAVLFIGFAGKIGWGFGLNALWIAGLYLILGGILRLRLPISSRGSLCLRAVLPWSRCS